MQIIDLVKEFCQRVGLGEIVFDPAQGAQLTMNETTLAIEAMPDTILLTASLGPVPDGADVDLFRTLLIANFELAETGGGSLALNATFDEIMVCRTILQADLPYEAFEREISIFVTIAEAWASKLRRGQIRDDAPEGGSDLESDPDAVQIRA